jgi:hypothetical protein
MDTIVSLLGNGDKEGRALLDKHIEIAANIYKQEQKDNPDALIYVNELVEPPKVEMHLEWRTTDMRMTWLTLYCTSTGYRTQMERKCGIGAPILASYITAVFDGYTMGLDAKGNSTTDPTQIKFKTQFDVVDAVRLWYARLA